MSVGIEKLAAYPGSLTLPLSALCAARGREPADIRDTMMIDERSLNVGWEDPVTMAVNAARPLLTEEDRARIGFLIVASESGVDQEKPMSTWVQRYLGLHPRVRNIEVKHACYGATASLQLAASWIASGVARGEKVLVINTDQSRIHLGQPWEFVLGAGAVAVLVSDEPRVLELELGRCGVYTNEVSDLTRPTPHVETGNSETSLLSYLEAVEAAYDDYVRRFPEAADFDGYFQRNVYHLPFGGMGYLAHKALLRKVDVVGKKETQAHFAKKTLPSLAYVRRMGSTYGASTFLGLMALLEHDPDVRAGDRVGVFSYGSGSCAELWSGRVCPEARQVVAAAGLSAALDRRRVVSVVEYEALERARAAVIDSGDYASDRAAPEGWYEAFYAGKDLLVFEGMREYYRRYGWS